jgi:RimJ/RimL family protein N-acetyltransferase
MQIRRLVPSDAAAYRALMLDGYRLHPDAFTASVDERAPLPLSWWESRVRPGDDVSELVVGAFDDARLVGVAGLRFEDRPKTRHKAWLYGMHVTASATGRGVGGRLVGAVLDLARRRDGVRLVQLTVSDGNASAQALYERCGFIPFGLEPLAITSDDGYIAKVHMWTDLEATDA